jgi:hypothetical protein
VRTFRFGNQVGLSPFFSRSISSTLSDVPCTGNLKLDSVPSVGLALRSPGLSGIGPSHNSVRILSSDTFLTITFPSGGDLETGEIEDFPGGVPRPPLRSS